MLKSFFFAKKKKQELMNIAPVKFDNVRNRISKKILVLPIEKHGCLVHEDCEPDFELITYSYDGSDENSFEHYFSKVKPLRHLSFKTEFFGESLKHIIKHLKDNDSFDLVLILNGDVMTSFSEVNRCFFLAQVHGLDAFQPSLSRDSFYSHQHLLNQPGLFVQEVPFIELMMLGLSVRVVRALHDENEFNISGWGLDDVLLPYLLRKNGWLKPHVIHASIARHCKPVESSHMIFSSGKSARDEHQEILAKYEQL